MTAWESIAQDYISVRLDTMSVSGFMEIVKAKKANTKGRHYISITGQMKPGKISQNDVAQLIPYTRSMERTRCIVSLLSSYIPYEHEYSTVGGIAMDIIDAYRNKEVYPVMHSSCTKTDRKRADDIEAWWKTVSGTSAPGLR